MTHILIVEDNKELATGLANNLQLEGYDVDMCFDGAMAFNSIQHLAPDLVILDMMLPHKDGFAIIKEIQKTKLTCCVLCLTARSEEVDKVRALRSGADDYLTKPFGLMELLARVEALLRRHKNTHLRSNIYHFADVIIDLKAKQVRQLGHIVNLTPKEYDLLIFMIKQPNVVHSRITIMQHVWGHLSAVNSRTVDTHIAELRKKLESPNGAHNCIATVPKFGYKFVT